MKLKEMKMKKNFKYKFDAKIELPLKITKIVENNDDITISFDIRQAKKNLKKLGNSNYLNLLVYRGWKIEEGEENGVL